MKRLRHLLRLLRRHLPAPLPVYYRRVTFPEMDPPEVVFGCTRLARRRGRVVFLIELNRGLPQLVSELVLLHEYAHCLSWNGRSDHNQRWARAYCRVWKWYSGEQNYTGEETP